MESIQIELIKDEGSKILFLKWLKDKSDEILKNHISEEDLVCFLREFFDFANGPKPSEIDEDNWEKEKFYIYSFVAINWPKNEKMVEGHCEINSIFLFLENTIIESLREKVENSSGINDSFYQITKSILENHDDKFKNHSSFFGILIPKLFKKSNPKSDEIFADFLYKIIKLPYNHNFSESDIVFISEIVRLLKSNEDYKECLSDFFNYILDERLKYTQLSIQFFFSLWKMHKKTVQHFKKDDLNPSVTLEKLAKDKMIDAPRSFLWHYCFQYYESLIDYPRDQMRVLFFICSTLFQLKKTLVYKRINIYSNLFSCVLQKQRKEKKSSIFLNYFFTNIISLLSSDVIFLRNIKCICLNEIKNKKLTFLQQSNDDMFIKLDKKLYTTFDYDTFQNFQDAINVCEERIKRIDNKIQNLKIAKDFYILGPFSIIYSEFDNENDNIDHNLKYYYLFLIYHWIRFIVYYSHKIICLTQFIPKDNHRFLSFNNLDIFYSSISKEFKNIPSILLDSVMSMLSNMLIKYLRKHLITYSFIIKFIGSITEDQKLFNSLISHLINKTISKLSLFLSSNIEDVEFIGQLYFLIQRIGLIHSSNIVSFNNCILTHYFMTLNTFFTFSEMIIHNSIAYKAIKIIKEYFDSHPQMFTEDNVTFTSMQLSQYYSLPKSSKKVVQKVIQESQIFNEQIDILSHNYRNIIMKSIYIDSIKYDDKIENRNKLLTKLRKLDYIKLYNDFYFERNDELSSIFSSSNLEIENLIEKDVNDLYFNSSIIDFHNNDISLPTFKINPFDIDLCSLLNEIVQPKEDSISEAYSIFEIIKWSFDLIQNAFVDKVDWKLFSLILSSCAYLSKYSLLPQIQILVHENNIFYANRMKVFKNFQYFLGIISILGINTKSKISMFCLDLFHDFLQVLKNENAEISLISSSINVMYSMCSFEYVNNEMISSLSIVIGLNQIMNFYPTAVKIEQFIYFLCHHKVRSFDESIISIYNSVVSKFIKNNIDSWNNLIDFCFKTNKISFIFCHMIIRSFYKNKKDYKYLPPEIKSEQIEGYQNPLFIQKAAFFLGCGIRNYQQISNSLYLKIIESLKLNIDVSKKEYVIKLYNILILLHSITSSSINELFWRKLDFAHIFFKHCYEGFTHPSKITKKIAKRCIKQASQFGYRPEIQNEIQNLFNFSETHDILISEKNQPRLIFLKEIIKIFHCEIPNSFVFLVIRSIIYFFKLKFNEKIKSYQNFVIFVKLISRFDSKLISQISLKKIINKNIQNNQLLVKIFLILYVQSKLNFDCCKKYFLKFFITNAKTLIEEVLNIKYNDIYRYFQALKYFILEDKKDVLLKEFLYALKATRINQIYGYEILNELLHEPRFHNNKFMFEYIQLIFTKEKNNFVNIFNAGENGFSLILKISECYLKTISLNITEEQILDIINLLSLNLLHKSVIQKMFYNVLFNDHDDFFYNFLIELIFKCIKEQNIDKFLIYETILKKSIKLTVNISNKLKGLLWDFIIDNNNEIYLQLVSSIINPLLDKNPEKENIHFVIKLLPKLLMNTNMNVFFNSLKIINNLLEKKLLPKDIYIQIISFLVYTCKCFEQPYIQYTLAIFKIGNEWLNPIPSSIIDSAIVCFSDKFIFTEDSRIIQNLQKLYNLCFTLHGIIYYLPFSPIDIIIKFVNEKLPEKSYNQFDPFFSLGIKICSIKKPNDFELNSFYQCCFDFLRGSIQNETRSISFFDDFCGFIIQNGCNSFPEDLIYKAKNTEYFNYLTICYIICSNTESILNIDKSIILNLISQLMTNEQKSILYIRQFFEKILSTSQLWISFNEAIETNIKINSDNITNYKIDIICNIMITILKESVNDKFFYIDFLIDGINELLKLKKFLMVKGIYRFLVSSDIPKVSQIFLYKKLLHDIKFDTNKKKIFFSILNILFNSNKIINLVKINVLKDFVVFEDIITKSNINIFDSIISFLKQIPFEMDLSIYIMFLYSYYLKFDEKVKKFREINELIEGNSSDRFLCLIKVLPLHFWQDKYILNTALLIIGDVINVWEILVKFSDLIRKHSTEVIKFMLKCIDIYKCSNELDYLFENVLNNPYNYHYLFSPLIDVVKLLNKLTPPIFNISNKIFNFDYYDYIDTFRKIDYNFLLPNNSNDYIFGMISAKNIQFNEIVAIAQYFLCNYNQSEQIFEKIHNKSSISQKIFPIVNQLCCTDTLLSGLMVEDGSKTFINYLDQSITFCKLKDLNNAKIYLQKSELLYQKYICNHINLSHFQKNLICTYKFLYKYLDSILKNESLPSEIDTFYQTFHLIDILKNVCYKICKIFCIPNRREIPKCTYSNCKTIAFPKDIESIFTTICGFDKDGFIHSGLDDIKKVCSNILEVNIKQNPLTYFKWATFCFTLYCQENEKIDFYLKSSIKAYSGLLKQSSLIPNFILFGAASRIITLLNFAPYQIDYFKQILNSQQIDKNVFNFWMSLISKLSDPIIEVLLNEAFVPFYSFTNSDMPNKLKIETKNLNRFIKFFEYINQLDIDLFNEQQQVEQIINYIKTNDKNTNIQKIKNSISKNIIDLVQSFIEKNGIKSYMNEDQIVELIIPSLNKLSDYSLTKRQFHESIGLINNNFPIIFPSTIFNKESLKIQMIKPKIKQIKKNQIIISCLIDGKLKNILIYKDSNNNFISNIELLSKTSYMFQQIMRYNYSTRIRSINLASSLGYLIEPNFYFCILSADIFSLDDLFYDLTGKKSLEWLKVNKECKKIENTDFTLKKMVLNKYTPENYNKIREKILRSSSASSLVRYLFGFNYQKLYDYLFCFREMNVPLIYEMLDISEILNLSTKSSFRISPNISNFFGSTSDGEILLSICSCSKSLKKYLSSYRAAIEPIFIVDSYSIEGLIKKRKVLEDRLLSITAPDSPSSTPKDSQIWFNSVLNLIKNAKSIESKPIDSLPWF